MAAVGGKEAYLLVKGRGTWPGAAVGGHGAIHSQQVDWAAGGWLWEKVEQLVWFEKAH